MSCATQSGHGALWSGLCQALVAFTSGRGEKMVWGVGPMVRQRGIGCEIPGARANRCPSQCFACVSALEDPRWPCPLDALGLELHSGSLRPVHTYPRCRTILWRQHRSCGTASDAHRGRGPAWLGRCLAELTSRTRRKAWRA